MLGFADHQLPTIAIGRDMSNLTIAVDAKVIKRARMRAIEQGTSLSAKVREFLQAFVDSSSDSLADQRKEDTSRLFAAMDVAVKKPAPRNAALTKAAKQPDPSGPVGKRIAKQVAKPVAKPVAKRVATAPRSSPKRKSLREDMYADDFRAASR